MFKAGRSLPLDELDEGSLFELDISLVGHGEKYNNSLDIDELLSKRVASFALPRSTIYILRVYVPGKGS
jgi:hypothetical protein